MSEIFKKTQKVGKNYLGSMAEDWNSIGSHVVGGWEKFKDNPGGTIANIFDQRISAGLEDLIQGTLGTRVSNIPDISGKILDAKNKARKNRYENLRHYGRKAEEGAPPRHVLQFPKQYFNEQGKPFQASQGVMEMEENHPGIDANAENYHGSYNYSAVFPNSIHFRTLKRPKQTYSEEAMEEAWWNNEWIRNYNNQDLGENFGSVGEPDLKTEPLFDVFLYLPQQLGDSVKVGYTEEKFGTVEAVFARLFAGSGYFGDLGDVTNMIGEQNIDRDEILSALLGMLPGGKIIQSAQGHMTNPMKFQALEGVNFRTYSYKFTLKPTTAVEAEEIRAIIYAFKHSMLPGTAGENQMIWTYPNEWAIRFEGPIKDWIDFPMTSVCTGCDIDYSGGGAVTVMSDGAPASIDMTLEFTETTQLSRQKYASNIAAANYLRRGRSSERTKILTQDFESQMEGQGGDNQDTVIEGPDDPFIITTYNPDTTTSA